MKKGLVILTVVALASFVFFNVGALAAANAPDNVKIENKGYKKDMKGAVMLSHKKHSVDYRIACTECHHDYQDGNNVWKDTDPVKRCSACHNPLKKKGKVMTLEKAYHKNCKECHKAYLKNKKDANIPFKKCNDCHAKKS